jgi:hypothetical protein
LGAWWLVFGNSISWTGCQYTGAFTDWANENNIAAVDIELTDHTNTDYEMNLKVLNIFLNWKR